MYTRLAVFSMAITLSALARGQEQNSSPESADPPVIVGRLEARQMTRIANPVEGTARIVRIVEEGTVVRAGDELVVLDTNRQEDGIRSLELKITQQRAEVTQLQGSMEARRQQSAAGESVHSAELQIAELSLQAWKNGEFPLQIAELEGAIQIAKAELEVAEAIRNAAETSPLDRLRARADVTRAKVEMETAQLKLRNLKEYVHPRHVAELEAQIQLARLEAHNNKFATEQEVASYVAKLDAQQQLLQSLQEELDRQVRSIRSATIQAPHAGTVVYPGQPSRRTRPLSLKEGMNVRERQQLLSVQNLASMLFVGSCDPETGKRLQKGQPVTVAVDALPNQPFEGKVLSVIRSTDTPSRMTVHIEISQPEKNRLLPGMTALASTITE